MEPFKKKNSLLKGVRFIARLEPIEREQLADSAASVVEALYGRARSVPHDELAEMTGITMGHTEAPFDSALAALLPSFFNDGDESMEGEAGMMRQLNEMDIIVQKVPCIQLISNYLIENEDGTISLDAEEADMWLRGLTSIRMYLNKTLENAEAKRGSEDPDVQTAHIFLEWLGYHQESLLTALMGDLDMSEFDVDD